MNKNKIKFLYVGKNNKTFLPSRSLKRFFDNKKGKKYRIFKLVSINNQNSSVKSIIKLEPGTQFLTQALQIFIKYVERCIHCVKSVRIWSYSGPAFGPE